MKNMEQTKAEGLQKRTTPKFITELQPNEIFCETVGTAVPYLWDEAGKKLGDVGMEDLLRINEVVELAKLLKRRMEDTSE